MFKPMLAAKIEDDEDYIKLKYPKLVSPKIDGIRATVQDGILYSRKLKPIPNRHLQVVFGRPEYNGLDGELCMGSPASAGLFQRTTSAVMSQGGTPDVTWWVFDCFPNDEPSRIFSQRLDVAKRKVQTHPFIRIVPHNIVYTLTSISHMEEAALEKGYEGIMLRDPYGVYKQGRSTFREQGLIKVKRFEDDEATIVDTFEQMENTNEQRTNELGRSKRSSHKAGLVGKDTLGGFICRSSSFTGQFNVGTGLGLTDSVRHDLWGKRSDLVGLRIKFKYQKCGTKDLPRMPIFLGFRDPID
jgi:DNA ligase-1